MSNQFAFTGRPGSRGGAGAYYNTGPDVTDVKQPNAGLSRTTTSSGCYTVVSRYDVTRRYNSKRPPQINLFRSKVRVRVETTALNSVDQVHIRPEHPDAGSYGQ